VRLRLYVKKIEFRRRTSLSTLFGATAIELYSMASSNRHVAHVRIANTQMSTHLRAMGHQFVTTRCRDRIRTDKCRPPSDPPVLHTRLYNVSVIRLSAREMHRFASPSSPEKLNADSAGAPVYPVVLVRVGDRRKRFEREYPIRDAPSSVNIRNGLHRFPVSSPALASSRQIKMTFYRDTLMERSQLLCLRRMQKLFRVFSLFLCVFYNNSHLCVTVFSML